MNHQRTDIVSAHLANRLRPSTYISPLDPLINLVSSLLVVNCNFSLVSTTNHQQPSRQSQPTYMPNINLQNIAILPSTLSSVQKTHTHDIVKPVVILVTRLKQDPKLQAAFRLPRARGLQEDIRAVVRAQVVSCVSAEDTGLRIVEAPVCAEVEDFACLFVSDFLYRASWAKGSKPRILGPVTLPPMIGMAVRMPRGPWVV